MSETPYLTSSRSLITKARRLNEDHLALPNGELFGFSINSEPIMFDPIRGLVVTVEPLTMNRFHVAANGNGNPRFLDALVKTMQDLGGERSLPVQYPTVQTKVWPTSLTLCLTTGCNLRCRYCYAEGGDEEVEMSFSCAEDAIRFMFQRAVGYEAEPIVNFSGGGEPTYAWEKLVFCIDFAKTLASEFHLRPRFLMNTNGLMNNHQVEFLSRSLRSVCLSLDGPQDVHNRYRVTPCGKGSFDRVFKTALLFRRLGTQLILRPTITKKTVSYVGRIIEFFGAHFPGARVDLEPVNLRGRSCKFDIAAPSEEAFLAAYLEACDLAPRWNLKVVYMGVGDVRERRAGFCGVTTPNFCVMPDGKLTGCYGYSVGDDLASRFEYGFYDDKQRTFVIDETRFRELQGLARDRDPACDRCFCKWQCSGECPARRIEKGGDISLSQSYVSGAGRCDLHRAIVLNDLERSMVKP